MEHLVNKLLSLRETSLLCRSSCLSGSESLSLVFQENRKAVWLYSIVAFGVLVMLPLSPQKASNPCGVWMFSAWLFCRFLPQSKNTFTAFFVLENTELKAEESFPNHYIVLLGSTRPKWSALEFPEVFVKN